VLPVVNLVPVSRRVVIAEDHPLMLSAISQVLEDAKGFEVVGDPAAMFDREPRDALESAADARDHLCERGEVCGVVVGHHHAPRTGAPRS